jgi:glycosyltransferase involved in cell wall biosynthesis
MKIYSPMAVGNGAYVLHRALEASIDGYVVQGYSPWRTLFPPSLYALRRNDAPVVHTASEYAALLARPGQKLVITFHNYVLDPFMAAYSSRAQRLHYRTDLRAFVRRAVKRADIITAVSQFTAQLLHDDLPCAKPIHVIYNGVDHERFRPADVPRSDESEIRVLFSGNPSLRKGAQFLDAIAERLDRNVKIFYTAGMRRSHFRFTSAKLVNIGAIPREAMPALYRQHDILLMPTVREGLSLAVLEAMASALPVVTSDASSMPEIIDHDKGGFLCPLGAIDTIAEALNTLAGSAELRRRMGSYNRERIARHFTQAGMVGQYRAIFSDLL